MKAAVNNKQSNWFNRQAIKFEESRFGAMTLMMIAQSCWGSVAALYTLKSHNITLLAICAAVTMALNVAFIAQIPAKWCLGIFYTSVLTNFFILVFSLFSLA